MGPGGRGEYKQTYRRKQPTVMEQCSMIWYTCNWNSVKRSRKERRNIWRNNDRELSKTNNYTKPQIQEPREL